MKSTTRYLLSATILPISLIGSANAALIAGTDFDGHTLPSTNTAGGLNWVLDGLDDPGSMAALNAAAGSQVLFDGNALMQNAFVPGLNTGNGNTFWTTTINLTVSAGSLVTLTDVTFDYLAVNGSQVLNVGRTSDFTVTLFNPSAGLVEAVEVVDTEGGTTAAPTIPTITATFIAPIALTVPGTYTLEIKGGDYLGSGETGNHTGIDNLSINGDVSVIPEPSSFALLGLGALAALGRRSRRS